MSQFFPDYIERDGFGGKLLKITTPVLAGWITDLKKAGSGWTLKRGITAPIFPHLMRRYNFSAKYFPSDDGGGAGLLRNGSWTGAVGDVVYGRADMTTQLAITFQRNSFLDTNSILF